MVSIYRWLMFLRDFIFSLVGFDARRSFRGVALRLFEMGGHVFHAHIFKSLASRHQAIVEADVGVSAVQLAHLESLRALAGDVQTFAFPIRSQKDVVIYCAINGLGKRCVERDNRPAVRQLCLDALESTSVPFEAGEALHRGWWLELEHKAEHNSCRMRGLKSD